MKLFHDGQLATQPRLACNAVGNSHKSRPCSTGGDNPFSQQLSCVGVTKQEHERICIYMVCDSMPSHGSKCIHDTQSRTLPSKRSEKTRTTQGLPTATHSISHSAVSINMGLMNVQGRTFRNTSTIRMFSIS